MGVGNFSYTSNNQRVRQGGIRVELWVELHVIPP